MSSSLLDSTKVNSTLMLAKAKRLEVRFGKSNLFLPTLTFELVQFYLKH